MHEPASEFAAHQPISRQGEGRAAAGVRSALHSVFPPEKAPLPMYPTNTLRLGGARPLAGAGTTRWFDLAPDALTTHAVVLGATGSGKTGLVTVLVEEALRAGVPTLLIDLKGDLSNLLLPFSTHAPEPYLPLLEGTPEARAREAKTLTAERSAEPVNVNETAPARDLGARAVCSTVSASRTRRRACARARRAREGARVACVTRHRPRP